MMPESRGACAEIACTRIDMGCDVKQGYCTKMDACGVGSPGWKRGMQHMRGVRMMTLDCAAVRGSVEITTRWTLTMEIMQECSHEHSSM